MRPTLNPNLTVTPFLHHWSLLAMVFLLSPPPTLCQLTNMFQWFQPVFQDFGYGTMCLDTDRSYIPTCGWQIAIRSNYQFYTIDTFECTNQKMDDYWYLCTNKNYNQDLTQPPDQCYNLNIQGNFWSTEPDLTVTWYCICDSGTNNQCEIVPEALPTTTTTTTTTAPTTTTPTTTTNTTTPTTTTPTTTTTTTTEPATTTPTTAPAPTTQPTTPPHSATVMFYPGYETLDPKEAMMTSYFDGTPGFLCYIASDFLPVDDVKSLKSCARQCIPVQGCAGVNYWQDFSLCQLVLEMFALPGNQLIPVSGCRHYRVVYKA